MPNPTVNITTVLSLAYDELDVARATYGVFDDNVNGNPFWQELALKNWAVNADLEVQKACAESPNSPYRNYFVNPTPATIVTSGGLLPATMIGPVQAVFVTGADDASRPARPCASTWIEYFNQNTQNVFGPAGATDRAYSQEDGRLYFKGASAQAYYCEIARGTITTLFSPEAFTNTIVKAVCGFPNLKQEDYMQAAKGWLEQYYTDLRDIRSGAASVPEIQTVQMAGV